MARKTLMPSVKAIAIKVAASSGAVSSIGLTTGKQAPTITPSGKIATIIQPR